MRQREIGDLHREIEKREIEIENARQSAQGKLATLELDGETAKDRLARAKPPR
jgi:ribosome recycling factor